MIEHFFESYEHSGQLISVLIPQKVVWYECVEPRRSRTLWICMYGMDDMYEWYEMHAQLPPSVLPHPLFTLSPCLISVISRDQEMKIDSNHTMLRVSHSNSLPLLKSRNHVAPFLFIMVRLYRPPRRSLFTLPLPLFCYTPATQKKKKFDMDSSRRPTTPRRWTILAKV